LLHLLLPVKVLHDEQAFVFGAYTAELWMQIDLLRALIRPFDPVLGAARQVVPFHGAALVALLTGAELFQIIRRRHAADVEEVLVLADSARTGFIAFAFRRDAVNGDFGLVDRYRPGDAQLRTE